jgi:enamine deaminase RidA (YjgF/YER057c/UK114 family)
MPPKAITSPDLGPTLGMYSHGVVVPAGELVVVAGQVGADREGRIVGPGDPALQTTQAFENVRAVLAAAGCSMTDVVRFQTFLTRAEDIDRFMQARREVFPRYYPGGVYPPNTLLIVSRLVEPDLLVEIEAMAVRPARRTTRARTASAGESRRRPAARTGKRRGRR